MVELGGRIGDWGVDAVEFALCVVGGACLMQAASGADARRKGRPYSHFCD